MPEKNTVLTIAGKDNNMIFVRTITQKSLLPDTITMIVPVVEDAEALDDIEYHALGYYTLSAARQIFREQGEIS